VKEQKVKVIIRIIAGIVVMVAGCFFFVDGFLLTEPQNFYEILIGFQIFLFGVALTQDKVELKEFSRLPKI